MANQVSKIFNYVVDTLDSIGLLNTIVFKDDDVIDVEKENIYPLVTIQILPSPAPLADLRLLTLRFEIVNQRDEIKKALTSKLMSDTNYIDNLNIVDSIANEFIMKLFKNDDLIGIQDDTVTDFEYVRKDERNCLDGVIFEATFYINQNNI